MPRHCDSLDGPVVKAARAALAASNVDLLLPYVKAESERELSVAFALAQRAREQGGAASEVAERDLFETAVRLHRAGEGEAFTGLKPAGLDVGPIIPVAEHAIEAGSPDELEHALVEELRHEIEHRFEATRRALPHTGASVAETRTFVEAMLGLQVWAHGVHLALAAQPHGESHATAAARATAHAH